MVVGRETLYSVANSDASFTENELNNGPGGGGGVNNNNFYTTDSLGTPESGLGGMKHHNGGVPQGGGANNGVAGHAGGNNPNDPNNTAAFTKKETKQVCWMRSVMVFVLFCVTIIVSFAAYYTAKEQERIAFEIEYDSRSDVIIDRFIIHMYQKLLAVSDLSLTITSVTNIQAQLIQQQQTRGRGRLLQEVVVDWNNNGTAATVVIEDAATDGGGDDADVDNHDVVDGGEDSHTDQQQHLHDGHYIEQHWPFVTVSNFHHKASVVRNIENAVGLYMIPIIEAASSGSGGSSSGTTTKTSLREEWETRYSPTHASDWVLEGLQYEGLGVTSIEDLESNGFTVPNEIYTISSLGTTIPSPTRNATNSSSTTTATTTTGGTNLNVDVEDDDSLLFYIPSSSISTQQSLFDKYYFPLWQSYPVTPDLTNYDLITTSTFRNGFTAMLNSEKAVIGTSFNLKSEDDGFIIQVFQAYWQETANVYGDDPVSQLYIPIWDKPPSIEVDHDGETHTGERKIVGILMAAIFWESYFVDSIAPESPPFLVELSNECSQIYSYLVAGTEITFLGQGDGIDDPDFDVRFDDKVQFGDYLKSEKITLDGMKRRTTRNTTRIQWNDEYCPYSIHVYPTSELYDAYHTIQPIILMIVAACIVAFTAILFATYDLVVERRQVRVATKLQMADEIVKSLFPERVRERLYENQQSQVGVGESIVEGNSSHASGLDLANADDLGPNQPLPPPEQSRGGRTPTAPGGRKKMSEEEDESDMYDKPRTSRRQSTAVTPVDKDIAGAAKWGKPIADIYQESTVFFCEVVGFTAWSSQREPAEVFTLLQTLFQCFDALAKKLGVFKVETVGEEYLAVTGLPEPQADHAVRMARFAREIMYRVQDLTRGLEVELGPDTGDLQLRCGINSGRVTAGVLKGENSRFQLFGDTVNTAARMKSNCLGSRIQCSESTAELLQKSGKGKWLRKRDELVAAKGKGHVQTYWILPRAASSKKEGADGFADMEFVDDSMDQGSGGAIIVNMPAQIHAKQRLIDWHVELLSSYLRRIEARRQEVAQNFDRTPNTRVASVDFEFKEGSSAVDEVTEIIKLPGMDPKDKMTMVAATKSKRKRISQSVVTVDPSTVELDFEVVAQLTDYVTTIASMYRENAFHNFEHATHVTMSTHKLLKRVVAPNDDAFADEDELNEYTYGLTSNPLTQFALIFCALIHDVDHAGVSNFQLIKEDSPLARLYEHRSVAEQNSIDISWDLLMDPSYSDLRKAVYKNEEELNHFRQIVVNIVLATDIFDKHMKDIREKRWDKAFLYEHQYEPDEETTNALKERDAPLTKTDTDQLKATIVMEHLVQASDISHTMQHWDIYLKWNERLFQEMTLAYEEGRSPKEPASVWYEGEMIFFDKYIIPLTKKLDDCGVFGVSSDECYNYATQNRVLWVHSGEEIVERFKKNYENKRKKLMNNSGTRL